MRFSIAGCNGSIRLASAPLVRSQAVRYWARSLEPIEKNDASNCSIAKPAAGTSTMMPSIRKRRGNPFGPQLIDRDGEQPARRFQFAGRRDHGKHDFEVRLHRGAGQRAKLHHENIRPRQTQPQAAHAEERVGLAVHCQSRHRLVAAGVERPDRDRALAGPAQNRVVGLILHLLVRQAGLLAEQKFGAHQPDAVGILRVRMRKIFDPLDVDQES